MGRSTDQPGDLEGVRFDPTTETYHRRHDWESSEPLCLTIVKTLAAATGQDQTTMDPLYSVVDPDALEMLLSTASDSTAEASFPVDGCVVTVAASGAVVVDPEV